MKLIKIIIFLLLLAVTVFEFSNVLALPKNWKKVDTRYDYNTVERFSAYLGMKCYDSLNCIVQGYLYGAGGYYIRRTTDGGETWKNVFMDSAYYFDMSNYKFVPDLVAISYPGPKLCIGVGDSGLIIRSTDKGETWEKKRLNDSIEFYRIIMADEYYGVIQGSYYKNRYHEVILETKDGGNSWNNLTTEVGLSEINFIKKDTLYGLSQVRNKDSAVVDVLIKVTNNWQTIDTMPRPNETQLLFAVDDSNLWVAGGSFKYPDYKDMTQKISRTIDGGKSWTTQRYGKYNGCAIECLAFYDKNFGIASTCMNITFITFDSGNNWIMDTIGTYNPNSGEAGGTFALQVPSITTGFIILEYDYIYKYTRDWTDGVEVEENKAGEFSISPNPAEDFIKITGINPTLKRGTEVVQIFNVFGEKIPLRLTTSPTPQEGNLLLDVSMLSSGVYFVRVGDKVGKFVKI